MIYLSQLNVSKSSAAGEKLSDAYAWHQALWKLFPGQEGTPTGFRFLFRVDDVRTGFRVLLLSPLEPTSPSWAPMATKPVVETFLQHTRYRFQIKANPTMRRNSDRRRLGIYGQERLREWVTRKAEQNGFELEENALDLGGPQDEVFFQKGNRGKQVAVDFRGILVVQNRVLFKRAFQNGIGSAKSLGYGLLMLQPIG